MTVNYDWSKEITCKLTNEKMTGDLLGRVKYAEYLTTYLKQYEDESYVFNINSSWGSGKTYFIKRWANTLVKKHPVIYFNSWKFDHNNEPLIIILSEVITQLNNLLPTTKNTKLKNKLTSSVTKTVKHIAPTLSKGIFKKVSGVDWDDLSEDAEQSADEKEDIKLGGELASVSTKALLNLHKEQQASIDDLKSCVAEVLSKVLSVNNSDNQEHNTPLYIFIDELDRCRPTFAIEVLEVIKHIFDIPRIIFVIATDTEQLQHSIKAVYGHDFDAEKYLMRFFNRSFSLPEPRLKDFLHQLPKISIIIDRLVRTNNLNIYEIDETSAIELITMLFEGFELELRSVDQIIERVSSILINHENELGVIILILLECIRTKKQSLFDRFWTQRIHVQAQGEDRLNIFCENLGVRRDKNHELVLSGNINQSIYAKNIRNSRTIESGGSISIYSIITTLTKQLSPPLKISVNSNEYNAQSAYYIETIGTAEGGLYRFKDYVELASNLT